MTPTEILVDRNRAFARGFASADMPILPKLRTVILACADARVDPAHVLGLELGEAVVIRNNGARVTPAVIEEIAALAFLVSQMEAGEPGPFHVVLMQHTQCGAERFADPQFQAAMQAKTGIDVAPIGITDHEQSLVDDIARLRAAPAIPPQITVSATIYDVKSGELREIVKPGRLG